MAGAVSRQWAGRSRRQNDRLHAFQNGIGEPGAALWSRKVRTLAGLDCVITRTTDGEIAIINLESARSRSWSKFFADPACDGLAETVIEHEQLTLQFVGDLSALNRVALLAVQLDQAKPASARTRLIQAQVASMAHRFSDARRYLAEAEIGRAPAGDVDRLRLTIDQACGNDLDSVLDARRRIATETGGIEDLVALGSLLADLRDFDAADDAYRHALQAYRDVSPFPIARICFQLGMLWGELASKPDPALAGAWYRRAIAILPMYTKALIHLAEIYLSEDSLSEAERLLRRVVAVGDPEVNWRLADALSAQGKFDDAEVQMEAAHAGFEFLLDRHLLAFADHGAELYAGRGNDCHRALKLARVNAANRPPLRALQQAHEIAIAAGDTAVASEFHSAIKALDHTGQGRDIGQAAYEETSAW